MISFNTIAANQRVPLFYAEFDNSNAVQGGAAQEYRTLLIGNRLGTGTVAALSLNRVTSAEQAKTLFGPGSVLANMAERFLKINKNNPLYCVPVADDGAGAAATGTFTVAGAPTAAGTVSLMVGGRNVKVGVTTSDTATTIATAIKDAINDDDDMLVTAGSLAGVVTCTARNKGEHGNEIELSHSYFTGEVLPAGITVTATSMSGGTGNPDIDDVWPVIGDDQYLLVVTPWTDAANLSAVESELSDRFGGTRMSDGYGLYGKRGTFGALTTLGDSRNSQFTTIMGVKGPSNPWEWAAELAAQVAASASIDPARPFQTLPLKVYAPKVADRFTLEERNQLLHAGIATFNVGASGEALIEGVITTFKENAFGSPDESYLYLNTPLTLSYIRFDLKARITSRYPRHKLASDGMRVAPGQAVVTPKVIKAEIVTKFLEWQEKALVEGLEQFKEDLVVERNADNPNRIDVLMPPDLVNQLRVLGVKIQYLL